MAENGNGGGVANHDAIASIRLEIERATAAVQTLQRIGRAFEEIFRTETLRLSEARARLELAERAALDVEVAKLGDQQTASPGA